MFLSHLLMLIVGILLSVGTNILTQSNPRIIPSLLFIASGLFLSFSAYIISKVNLEAEKASGDFSASLNRAWKEKNSIGLQRKIFNIIFVIISIIFFGIAIVKL